MGHNPLGQLRSGMRKYPGLVQFLARAVLLLVFLFLLQFASLPFVDGIIIPEEFYTIQYIALGGVLMVSIVVFLLLVKDSLDKFPAIQFSLRDAIVFAGLGFALHVLFFWSKSWIAAHPFLALNNMYPIIALRYFFLAGSVLSFVVAFYGLSILHLFIGRFRRELLGTAAFAVIFTLFSYLVQYSWQLLSFTITRTEYVVMSVIFPGQVTLYGNETLGIGNFVVNIGKVCSGVESLLLFTTLYALIFFLDRKKLSATRMLLLFIPGLIGDFITNILRISLILLLGVWISPQFAVGIFHTNAGWVFFILYFFVFWYGAYPWVKK